MKIEAHSDTLLYIYKERKNSNWWIQVKSMLMFIVLFLLLLSLKIFKTKSKKLGEQTKQNNEIAVQYGKR